MTPMHTESVCTSSVMETISMTWEGVQQGELHFIYISQYNPKTISLVLCLIQIVTPSRDNNPSIPNVITNTHAADMFKACGTQMKTFLAKLHNSKKES